MFLDEGAILLAAAALAAAEHTADASRTGIGGGDAVVRLIDVLKRLASQELIPPELVPMGRA